jgi:hypothetical protein
MASNRYFARTNVGSSDHVLIYDHSNILQINNGLTARIENQDLNRRINTIEETLNKQIKKENIELQQFQDKLGKLEERAIQLSINATNCEELTISK